MKKAILSLTLLTSMSSFATSNNETNVFKSPELAADGQHQEDPLLRISCDIDYDSVCRKLSDDSMGKYNFTKHISAECEEMEYGKLSYLRDYAVTAGSFLKDGMYPVAPMSDHFRYDFIYNSNGEAELIDKLKLSDVPKIISKITCE